MKPPPLEPRYTIYDISSETGVPVKTIKQWTWLRLVPQAASKRKDGINYNEDHIRWVSKMREWRESQITLTELAERIEVLGEKALEVTDPYADFDGWE